MEMQAYLTFLSQLREALDSLAALEQKKIKAIQDNDLATLEECMKREQVATLDLRGREQKRNELLKQLGLEQVTLRELPSHCPAEYRGQAAQVSEQVRRSYQVLSSAQKAARTLMESNLRRIDKELERRQQTEPAPAQKKSQTDFRV